MMKIVKLTKNSLSNPQAIWIPAAALVGFLLTLYLFYPGYMSYDSVNQLSQGRMGVFNDWNPPVMSWLWGQIDRVLQGPIGMLILINLLFWSGLGLWIALVVPGWSAPVKAFAILAIGLFPPIFMLLSTIWKDVGMAASLLFASGWLAYAEQKGSLLPFFVGFSGMWFALALRHNAVFALFPLMIYAGIIFFSKVKLPFNWLQHHRFLVSGALGLGLLGISLVTTVLTGRYLTHFSTTYSQQQILTYDLVAISVHADEILLPDYLTKPQQATIADLRKIYATEFPVVCLNRGCGVSELRIKAYTTPHLNDTTIRTWIKAVLTHPQAYLAHRLQQFMRQFGFSGGKVCYPYITSTDRDALTSFGITPDYLGAPREETAITHILINAVERVKNSLLFRGWIYLAFLTLLLGYTLIRRRRKLKIPTAVIAVAASGCLYGLSYLPLSTTCDFRMHYWTVMAAIVCAAAVLGHARH